MQIIKYESDDEAHRIIAEKTTAGFTLVEVSNISEGNFLGFQEPGWEPPEYQKPLEYRIDENTEYLIDLDFRLSMIELGF